MPVETAAPRIEVRPSAPIETNSKAKVAVRNLDFFYGRVQALHDIAIEIPERIVMEIYLHRDSATAPWRLVTYLHGGDALRWSWRADYDDFHDGLPRVVRLVSADQRRFNLELTLSQLEPNVQLKPEVFRVDVPANAERISVEELKRSGLLGAAKDRDQ